MEHLDVLVVGAGLSGIGAGYHLQANCPGKTYAILEGRESLGGTWDLFRYPGIRSDSDMYTLGFSFRPWTNPKAIADGPSILQYLRDTAEMYGIDEKIRYGTWVESATWDRNEARWTVRTIHNGNIVDFSCSFLFMCAGYYDYDAGYTPKFEGVARFEGRVVHPQKWTEDIEYEGKKVVVIGSGATAMTLVPELAKKAEHVTMLQRSPTYVVSAPEQDKIANWLRERLPAMSAYKITRWKNVLMGMAFFRYTRRFPKHARKFIVGQVRKQLGEQYDVETHFNPRYNPWDQRLCLVPEADLFKAIRAGDVSVVTDTIETFTETGLHLTSGEILDADLIVTATGLQLKFLGGMKVIVEGREPEPSETMTYKGMMFSDVPNLAMSIGYTNASWTLKCDLTCEFVCRLLNHMEAKGYSTCTPRRNDPSVKEEPLLDFTAGYVQRRINDFPRGGSKAPWKLYQNYALDMMALRHAPIEDGVMEFAR